MTAGVNVPQLIAPLDPQSWRQVVDTAQDIIYVLSPDGVFLDMNPRMCRLFRQPREKLVGTRLTAHLDRDQIAFTERVLKEVVERKTGERSTRSFQIVGGEPLSFEITESPLIREGNVWAIAGIGREITQEVVLERKLWDTVESEQSAVDFALRTSLGLVKGYVYTLGQNGSMEEDRRVRYAQIIEEEIDHLAKIIEDLLDVRRLENAEYEIHLDVVDAADCIHCAVRQCEVEAQRRDVELVVSIPEQLDPLYLPREAFCRIILNLVQNAIHHTLHSGTVWLDVQQSEGYLEIIVRDNGVGIPDTDMPFIFDKYYRGKSSAASPVQGVGLGLAIARMFAEALGGKILVTSKVGAGSEFRLVLPRRSLATTEGVENEPWKSALIALDSTSTV